MSKATKKIQIGPRIPTDLLKQIQAIAEQDERTLNKTIERLLRDSVDRYQHKD
jgi:hypothetical protein